MSIERIEPGPGQESVWDYPRPPRLEPTQKEIRVVADGVTVAKTNRAHRVLETSHPPVYYIPPEDILAGALIANPKQSWCEWKGRARYFDLQVEGRTIPSVGWSYPSPTPAFASIRNFVAFYPSKVAACYVDGERVRSQEGDFYGGWITADVVGPFKGAHGTMGW